MRHPPTADPAKPGRQKRSPRGCPTSTEADDYRYPAVSETENRLLLKKWADLPTNEEKQLRSKRSISSDGLWMIS